MRKITLTLAMVALIGTSTLFANENTKNGDQTNQMTQTMRTDQTDVMENSQISSDVDKLLRKNAKLHRYSSDFAFIMVNDKIEKKYKAMNYQTFRYFKYDVDFVEINKNQK